MVINSNQQPKIKKNNNFIHFFFTLEESGNMTL